MGLTIIPEYPDYPRSDGTCFICHASRRPKERVVDLGVTYDHVEDLSGNVHMFKIAAVCEACILELAALMGCIAPDKTRELGTRLMAAEDERDRLRNKLNQLASDFLEEATR